MKKKTTALKEAKVRKIKTPKITVCNTYPTPTAEYGGCFLPTEDYEGINELKDKQMVSLSKDYYADQAISDLETF